MKRCSTCKVEKPIEEFGKNKTRKDGLHDSCKLCKSIADKKSRIKHIEKRKLKQKEYAIKNADKISEYQKQYREENKEKLLEYGDNYYKENKEKILKQCKEYRDKHKDEKRERDRLYRLNNLKKVLERQRNYYQEHKVEFIARSNLRRARKLQATPSWLTEEQILEIKEMFLLSEKISKETGVRHHVDHIYPLTNPIVCGLHVPWNLQIVESKVNLKKGNKFFQDEEEFEVFMQMIEEEVLMEKEGNFQKSVDTAGLSEYNTHISTTADFQGNQELPLN